MLPRHLYVHVPFCARRCTYCDFAIAVRSQVPVDDYVAALRAELRLRWESRAKEGGGWELDTLYFGGGTPSRLGGEGVARTVDAVRAVASLAAGAEVTLEANPEDVSPDSVSRWRDAGINRVSLGVQSFHDPVLAWMHRVHDSARAIDAVSMLRDGGIENLSLDLIFALPEGVERSWRRDVETALSLEPAHVSLYGLTVEGHTPLGRRLARGEITEAPDERYEEDFLLAHRALTDAGLDHYEVSNFGKPGLHSRHNSAYWTQAPYAGVGPGAHELDGDVRRWNEPAYVAWARTVTSGSDPVAGQELLSAENRTAEEVYLGLRSRNGLRLGPGEVERVARWIDSGWGTVEPADDGSPVLRLSALGWLRLDALAADLTARRSR
jgi:oxygen-independent coproporphyrinogen III oxidase